MISTTCKRICELTEDLLGVLMLLEFVRSFATAALLP